MGRGGQLLDKMLAAVDLDRHTNIYITNIVKCRPPHNRDPLPQEQEALHRLPAQPVRAAAAENPGVPWAASPGRS